MRQATELHSHTPVRQQIAILTFILFYFIRWFVAPMSMVEWVINITALVLFLLCYFICFNFQKWVLPSAAIMILMSVMVAPYNFGANCFAIYACSFFAYTQPSKRAILLCAGTLGLMACCTYFMKLDIISYFAVGAVIIVGSGASGILERQRIQHDLKQRKSQDEISRLAKIAERERISQDLHDVVGHSLTAIHLTSQLAQQLVAKGDYDKASECLHKIQLTSQNSLKEIRETLSGMNKLGLAAELEAQQEFLHSIGIEFEYLLPMIDLPPKLESDLLLIVRESVTNIVRHSHATSCHVTIAAENDWISVLIQDNGVGLKPDNKLGSGLAGIQNRVNMHGGSVSYDNARGLALNIRVPTAGVSTCQSFA